MDVWSPICRGEEPAVPLTDTQRVTASSSGATSTSASTYTAAAPTASPAAAAANGFGPGSRSQSRGALSASVSGASLASASGAGVSVEAAARVAAFEKGLKLRCALAVEHFNKDYKKGFQFLQVRMEIQRMLSSRQDIDACCESPFLATQASVHYVRNSGQTTNCAVQNGGTHDICNQLPVST